MQRYLLIASFLILVAGLSFRYASGAQTQTGEPPMSAPSGDPPAAPQGVEVLARGPVHEAFATPTAEPVPTKPVCKKPPKALDEMPPEQKPEGEVVWVSGYWAWDDDRKDYLWVSGIWRTPPPGKQWVAGYWREAGSEWQWVPGFWTAAAQETTKQDLTYLPTPPAPPEVAPPGEPPSAESFYVPGVWVWGGERYAWRAGYWGRVQPGYVWVAAHYVWTPTGYVFVPGYWDLAISRRGVLFAPVIVDPNVVGATFVYTPGYVVSDTILVDALFVRPCYCHYYFGDYYGPAYREIGFESCIVFGRRHYDPLFTYVCWEHRSDSSWLTVQLDLTLARHAGQAPCPPRTLVQQNTVVQQNITNVTNNVVNNNITKNVTINNTTINNTSVKNVTKVNAPVLVPASQMAAVKGIQTVPLSATARMQARQQAQAVQQVVSQRSQAESSISATPPSRPRVASINLPRMPTAKTATVSTGATSPTTSAHPAPTASSHSSTPNSPSAMPVPAAPARITQSNTPNNPQGSSQFVPGTTHPSMPGPYRPNQTAGGTSGASHLLPQGLLHPQQKPNNSQQKPNHEKPTHEKPSSDHPPSSSSGNSP
jgi:hypothetical protein